MAFAGKYELESQENYEEFLEAIGIFFLNTRVVNILKQMHGA